MNLELLPQDCITQVLYCTSPRDACQLSIVSTMVRDAAESDLVWEKFLPSDYQDIVSRSVSPLPFTSKKELFLKLSNPLLIDGGNKTFSIDKLTNKICYMLSSRELSITWATNPLYWSWKSFLPSRFPEVAELIMVTWLDIHGKINTKLLSPNTTYGAYLVIKVADRAFGFDSVPSEVSIEVGNDYQVHGKTYLRRGITCCPPQQILPSVCLLQRIAEWRSGASIGDEERVLHEREDGWLEIELGEFYNDGSEKDVKMRFREVKGEHLKGGLIVEGIELRPKLL